MKAIISYITVWPVLTLYNKFHLLGLIGFRLCIQLMFDV